MSRRRRVQKLAAAAASVLLFFVAAELGCRALGIGDDAFASRTRAFAGAVFEPDETLGMRPRAGAEVEVGGVRYAFDANGCRSDAAVDAPVDVVVVGDSVAMGWGVANENAFAAQLARALPSSRAVRNCAILGHGISEYPHRVRELGAALAPQRIVIGYYPNDPEPVSENTRRSVWSRSRFVRLGNASVSRVLVGLGLRPTALAHYQALHAESSASWARVEQGVAALGDACRAVGATCTVVLFPALIGAPYPLAAEHARVARVVREAGMEVVDLAPATAAHAPQSLWVEPDDYHPNSTAHRAYARALAAAWRASADDARAPGEGP